MARKTIHTFSIHKEALIWKILPDTNKNIVLIESRHEQTQTCKYFLLDLNSYLIKPAGFKSDHAWWLNIVDFRFPFISMEEFTDDQNPTVKSFTVYNLDQGKEAYKKEGMQFICAFEGTLVLGTAENQNLILLDYVNFKEAEINKRHPQFQKYFTPDKGSLKYNLPVQYLEGDEYFNVTAGFIKKALNDKPVRSIEYLEFGKFVCLSYYMTEDNFLVNFLLVLNKKGEILFKDKLDSKLKGIGSEAFFIFNEHLIFVKNKNEIAVYPLIEN